MFWVDVVVIGLSVGSIYALYGLGITLIYKATRVPNFAHGAVGMFGAYLFFKTWERSQAVLRIKTVHLQLPFGGQDWTFVPPRLPMWGAFLVAAVATGLLGLAIARLMRVLEGAPTVLLIVATLGLTSIITGLVSDWFSSNAELVPQTVPEGYHHLGGVRFDNFAVVIAIVSLAIALGMGAFFRYTNLGIAIRATADSREVARLLGINANAVAAFAWVVGSILATVAAILITPRNQLDQLFLFTLIVPGFAAALFGGFTSLVLTFAGGLVLGVVESVVKAAPWPPGQLQLLFTKSGTAELVAFLVIVVVLMTRPRFIFKGVRVEEESGVGIGRLKGGGLGPEDRIRRQLDQIGALPVLLRDWRAGRWILGVMLLAVFVTVPALAVSYWSTVLATGTVYALVALSVVVLTGWTGQLSVAPLAFAGAGAWGAALLAGSLHVPFFLTIPLAGLVGVPIALLIGVPALRLRGFYLAIATMAFALAAERWLFTLPALTARTRIPRGVLREDLTQPTLMVSLLVAGLLFLAVWNVSRSRVARAWYALRDSETTAVAMGIDPVRYKLLAFVVAGYLAGVGGALFGYVNRILNAPSFSLQASLSYITFAIIAGVGEIFGAFLVGVFQVAPSLWASPTGGVNQAPYIFSGVLAILTVAQYPNGLAAYFRRLVRPFHISERIAWSSAEDDDEVAARAVAARAEEVDLTKVADEVIVNV